MKINLLIIGIICVTIENVQTSSFLSFGENWIKYFISGPDLIKNTEALVQQQKYGFEAHNVTTTDGYIIELHRIPSTKKSGSGIPLLLHHGSFGSSALWVLNSPSQSLGFLLANLDFDVWLANVRGNKYGRHHTTLDPNKKEFWQFSWDKIASHDLPSIIDYIFQITGQSKVNIIAHSLGVAQMFALLSSNDPYNDKVEHIYALAPEVNLTKVKSFFTNVLATLHPLELTLLKAINTYEIDVSKIIHEKSFGLIFKTVSTLIANFATLTMFGINFDEMSPSRYPLIASHLLSGASLYTVGQLLQVIKTNKFGMFDWGKKTNKLLYGQNNPPDYDIRKVRSPVTLFYAKNDAIVSESSVDYLEKTLPNVKGKYVFGSKRTNHFDFFTSTKAGEYYQQKLLALVKAGN